MAQKRGRPINPKSARQQKQNYFAPVGNRPYLDPVFEKYMIETNRKLVASLERDWRLLRMNGVTPRYLEMLDATDPSLIDAADLLTEAQAKAKYADAIALVDAAKMLGSDNHVGRFNDEGFGR